MAKSTESSASSNGISTFLKAVFHFFLFTSLYISLCAVLMVHQTNHLFSLHYNAAPLFYFVFFSTICSYNFHWYLTPHYETEQIRVLWTEKHKKLQWMFYIAGLAGSAWFSLQLIEHWIWLGGAVLLTFLYSAPNLPFRPFTYLRKIAIGKTIFLSFVWMYVTSLMPIMISGSAFETGHLLFCISRFFLIYSICIIFDYRDRENDKKEGIKSMITIFNDKGIDRLFYISLIIFFITTGLLYTTGFDLLVVVLLIIPGLLVLALYRYAKKTISDYLYYFVLDGLMMCSALFTSFLSI